MGERQAREVAEVEGVVLVRAGERDLGAEPGDEDDREAAEEVAAHGDEHVGVTGEQLGDRLDNDGEVVVGGHSAWGEGVSSPSPFTREEHGGFR